MIYSQPIAILAIIDIEVLMEKRKSIIEARHDVKSVGHLGIAKTIELVTRDFIWLGLRKDVERYI